jgi:hypothetical protein
VAAIGEEAEVIVLRPADLDFAEAYVEGDDSACGSRERPTVS